MELTLELIRFIDVIVQEKNMLNLTWFQISGEGKPKEEK